MIHGDCIDVLEDADSQEFDSLVTDPPAGIAFMGKDWDKDKGGRDAWIEWMSDVMRECLRVMKPGAHGFVWALPRTSHWTATACENAGFEIRDVVMHVFGSGFPKSHDVSKAIDKEAGAEREVLGKYTDPDGCQRTKRKNDEYGFGQGDMANRNITAPSTPEAKQWEGWGTALKPAAEHWILIRKPFKGTVAKNVLEHGTGAINVDASRVEGKPRTTHSDGNYRTKDQDGRTMGSAFGTKKLDEPQGRFPANFICSGEARDVLDEQSGECKTGALKPYKEKGKSWFTDHEVRNVHHAASSGGASRFFYCAKASKSERNAGADNNHPTVKAQKLMRYLIKMITPPGGKVLDPFAGSGSTGVAAIAEGFEFLGIEAEKDYIKIANARIENAQIEALV